MNTAHLIVVAPGLYWPSGDYIELAVLDIDSASLSQRLGVPLQQGEEPGLGPWEAIGAKLQSGDLIEFISYAQEPYPGFTLRADAGNRSFRVISESLAGLGLREGALLWVSPLVQDRA